MRRLKWILIFWLAFSSAVNAEEVPKEYRAERMYNLCKGEVRGEDKGMQSMVCTFRLQGVVSMMIENCSSVTHGFKPFPLLASGRPPSRGATRQAFINFIEANPDKWGLPWHVTVSMALSEAFPCKR